MTVLVRELGEVVGVARACTALGMPRPSYYRRRRPGRRRAETTRPPPPRALDASEQQEMIDVLHSEPFVDHAPAQVVAALPCEGIYHCSARAMYRIPRARGEVRERRNRLVHPRYPRPELLATRPNQVWSSDITKLRAAQKWTYYDLYVLLKVVDAYRARNPRLHPYDTRFVAHCDELLATL